MVVDQDPHLGPAPPVAPPQRRRTDVAAREARAQEGGEVGDRGARVLLVAGVVERAGKRGLERLWRGERELPTPAEVDAPGLWLARIDLPDPD